MTKVVQSECVRVSLQRLLAYLLTYSLTHSLTYLLTYLRSRGADARQQHAKQVYVVFIYMQFSDGLMGEPRAADRDDQ